MQSAIVRVGASLAAAVALCAWLGAASPPQIEPFTIEVIDKQTGRGVPLVELKTTHGLEFVTDSNGLAVVFEPELMGQAAFFHVKSHGYAYPADGFGIRGRRVQIEPGGRERLTVTRENIAERLYRITGAGIYRDSVIVGEPVPLAEPLLSAKVVGQDAAQAVVYRGQVFWCWGDTALVTYPLGNYRASAATSTLPGDGGLAPDRGIDLTYFVADHGAAKPMCPFEPKAGVVWLDGLVAVADEKASEKLVAHFTRLEKLDRPLEHGIVVYNDETEEFERRHTFARLDDWRHPRGHSLHHREGDRDFVYFGSPFPTVRVAANSTAVLSPSRYEAWTCLAEGSSAELDDESRVVRDEQGRLVYRWTTGAPPMDADRERKLIELGRIRDEEARFQPRDVETGKPVRIHNGSVRWNKYRKRWTMIAAEEGGTSYLGEVWYSEAPAPTGPWRRAIKIVTHDDYSFYNPVQHAFFDEQDGRLIYFEGTYSNQFSGSQATPRYDYNQIMYRLDLADPRLEEVQRESGDPDARSPKG